MIITIILQTYIMQKSAKKHLRGVTWIEYEEKNYKRNLRGVTINKYEEKNLKKPEGDDPLF